MKHSSNDHIEETVWAVPYLFDSSFSKYYSFIFYLSITIYIILSNRSDFHEEFADERAQIISQPEYDCFFKDKPELGNFTMDVVGNIFKQKNQEEVVISKRQKTKPNDKTEHGKEKTVKSRPKSKNVKSDQYRRIRSQPAPELKNTMDAILTHLMGRESPYSHASSSGTDEGTGYKPGVPDVPTYVSDDEQISWKSSDKEDDDEVAMSGDDDDDADNQDDDDNDDDDQNDDNTNNENDDNDDDDAVVKQFVENKGKLLEHPISSHLLLLLDNSSSSEQALAAHAAWVNGSKEIAALMLMTMDLDI
ncbi:hypothetical protein Tco_0524435 [Tanacetum coccineum]